jgi:hypothetical protein
MPGICLFKNLFAILKQRWTIGKMSRSTAVAPRGEGIAQLGIVIQQTIEISLYHPLFPLFQST